MDNVPIPTALVTGTTSGPLAEIPMDHVGHIDDRDGQPALWNVTSPVVGGVGYKAV